MHAKMNGRALSLDVVGAGPAFSDRPGATGAAYLVRDDRTAIPEFQRARKFNANEPGASLGLAVSLEKAGRVDEGVQEYHYYLEMRPPVADANRVKAHLALLSRSHPQVK